MPNELLYKIISHCGLEETRQASLVSHQLHNISKDVLLRKYGRRDSSCRLSFDLSKLLDLLDEEPYLNLFIEKCSSGRDFQEAPEDDVRPDDPTIRGLFTKPKSFSALPYFATHHGLQCGRAVVERVLRVGGYEDVALKLIRMQPSWLDEDLLWSAVFRQKCSDHFIMECATILKMEPIFELACYLLTLKRRNLSFLFDDLIRMDKLPAPIVALLLDFDPPTAKQVIRTRSDIVVRPKRCDLKLLKRLDASLLQYIKFPILRCYLIDINDPELFEPLVFRELLRCGAGSEELLHRYCQKEENFQRSAVFKAAIRSLPQEILLLEAIQQRTWIHHPEHILRFILSNERLNDDWKDIVFGWAQESDLLPSVIKEACVSYIAEKWMKVLVSAFRENVEEYGPAAVLTLMKHLAWRYPRLQAKLATTLESILQDTGIAEQQEFYNVMFHWIKRKWSKQGWEQPVAKCITWILDRSDSEYLQVRLATAPPPLHILFHEVYSLEQLNEIIEGFDTQACVNAFWSAIQAALPEEKMELILDRIIRDEALIQIYPKIFQSTDILDMIQTHEHFDPLWLITTMLQTGKYSDGVVIKPILKSVRWSASGLARLLALFIKHDCAEPFIIWFLYHYGDQEQAIHVFWDHYSPDFKGIVVPEETLYLAIQSNFYSDQLVKRLLEQCPFFSAWTLRSKLQSGGRDISWCQIL